MKSISIYCELSLSLLAFSWSFQTVLASAGEDEIAKLEQQVFKETPKKLLTPKATLAKLKKLSKLLSQPGQRDVELARVVEKFIDLAKISRDICMQGDKFMSTDVFADAGMERLRNTNIELFERHFRSEQFAECNKELSSRVKKFERAVSAKSRQNFENLVGSITDNYIDSKGPVSVADYKLNLTKAVAASLSKLVPGKISTKEEFSAEFDRLFGEYCKKIKEYLSEVNSFYTPLVLVLKPDEELIPPKSLFHVTNYKTCDNLLTSRDQLMAESFGLYEQMIQK